MSPSSRNLTSSGLAPFWGPNTKAAPSGPYMGFSMSHIAMISVFLIMGLSSEISMRLICLSVPPVGTKHFSVLS